MVAVAPRRATAQVGATTDIITGTVTGPDSQPLAGAVVQAISLETQISRQRTTDARGRFTIVFPDGGGRPAPAHRPLHRERPRAPHHRPAGRRGPARRRYPSGTGGGSARAGHRHRPPQPAGRPATDARARRARSVAAIDRKSVV